MINISRYSGKADFCDTIDIFGVNEIINKYKIYAPNQILPLEVNEPKDLIPYYPFLTSSMSSNKETRGVIYLTSESYIDTEEREHLTWTLDNLIRIWRRCKRKKIPFDKEEALAQTTLFTPREHEEEIADRVAKFGDKATIDGIHLKLHDRYRQDLYEEMIKNGWDESRSYIWCFGFDRWIKRNKEEKNDLAI